MARLTVMREGGGETTLELPGTAIVVGSDEGADLILADATASPRHCLLFNDGDQWAVQDLGSEGGTWINGEKVESREALNAGDQLRVGDSVLVMDDDSAPAVPAAPDESAPEEPVAAAPTESDHPGPKVDPDFVPEEKTRPERAPAPQAQPDLFEPEGSTKRTLRSWLEGRPLGRLAWREALAIAGAVARVLARAKEFGIVHGAMDLDHVVRNGDGSWTLMTPGQPAEDAPHYTAPELLAGQTAEHSADLYSLGILLYRMLTGRPPFADAHAEDLPQRIATSRPDPVYWVAPGLPKTVQPIVDKLIAADPERRYAGALDVVAHLEGSHVGQDSGAVTAAVRKRAGIRGVGWIAAALVVGCILWTAAQFMGDAKEQVQSVVGQVENVVDDAKRLATQPDPDDVAAQRAAAAAKAAVDAIDKKSEELDELSSQTKAEWLAIADAYEGLLHEHSPEHGCVQRAYLRCRIIRTDVVRLEIRTGKPSEDVAAAGQQVLDAITAEIEASGEAVLPEDVTPASLKFPRLGTTLGALQQSWDEAAKIAEALRQRGASGDAMRTVGYWLHHVRPVVEGRVELNAPVDQAEAWLRGVALQDTAILASDLSSDLRLLRRAYGATRLVRDGLPIADDDGSGLCFGAALYALEGIHALLRTPVLTQRAATRRGRIQSTLDAWSAALGELRGGGLVKDGAPIHGVVGHRTLYFDASGTPSLSAVPMKKGTDEGAERVMVPWTQVPADVIARDFLLPFVGRGAGRHHAGVVWLIVSLELPGPAELALSLGDRLAEAEWDALEKEIATLRRVRELETAPGAPGHVEIVELLSTDTGLMLRGDLATSWDRMIPKEAFAHLFNQRQVLPDSPAEPETPGR